MYGDYVCKFGKTTGFTCGTVSSTVYDPGTNFNPTFVLVDSPMGIDLSLGGDSGAPWYSGSIAYGLHHDSSSFNALDAVFMSIEYLPNGFVAKT